MKELSEYTDIEKIEWFDKMYGKAHEQFMVIKEHGIYHESTEHLVWEEMIELLGKDIWTEWNNYYHYNKCPAIMDEIHNKLFSLEEKYIEKFGECSVKEYTTAKGWMNLTVNEKIDLLTKKLNGNEP